LIEEKEACLREARAMISKWNPIEDGKVKVWLAPRSLGGCSKELYEEVAETARESQTGVTMHLAEVKEDIHYTETNYGQKPVEFIQSVGLTGRNVLFAHMVWLDEEEIHLVAKTGTNVVHCPSSNLKLASGIPKIPEMLVAGVNVSLGCDGAPCNNSYDLIRELKLAGLIQKARLLDPKAMPASTVMEMATINGARAIGMESELGSIEKGKRADLALIDLRKPHLVPYHDIVSNLVYSAMGSDVETVLIDGKIIVDKGNVRTIDETRVLAEADARRTDLIARAGIKL
jgi:cytosine/adenosine deaminase-related metal-dependent hydrolase